MAVMLGVSFEPPIYPAFSYALISNLPLGPPISDNKCILVFTLIILSNFLDTCPFQIGRLHECEKMLVALEMAGWLNESNLALQAVVQCYGLLAPMIHYKIPAVPAIQVLFYCRDIKKKINNSRREPFFFFLLDCDIKGVQKIKQMRYKSRILLVKKKKEINDK